MQESVAKIFDALGKPFDPENVHCKPLSISGSRALVCWYVNARDVMDRLDEVLGGNNWQDAYQFLPDGNVLCTLRVRIEGEWLEKSDVGGPSEQPDEGDRCKAAVSDSLKRAAVHYNIGRYLYRLPSQWLDYDPQKKRFVNPPKLPPLVPAAASKPRPAPTPVAATAVVAGTQPTTTDLLPRLNKLDKDGSDKGWYRAGQLVSSVLTLAETEGWPGEIRLWDDLTIAKATEHAKAFWLDAKTQFEEKKKEKKPATVSA